MKRLVGITAAITVALAASIMTAGMASASTTCVTTPYQGLTAAVMGGNVTGTVDASAAATGGTPCDIGVYFDANNTGSISGATISGATYFGVLVNGTSANVTAATVSLIGDVPQGGNQHGMGVAYFGGATGTVSGTTVSSYQKNGIKVSDTGTNVSVLNNTVNGDGPTNRIAQNGIEIIYGASATVSGNTVTGNAYTGSNLASSGGILVVGGPCFGLPSTVNLSITKNTLTNNDVGVWLFNANATCDGPVAVKTNNTVKFNTISNGAVTNTTGYSATCGYQAGIADVGHKDLIVNNKVSGFGYTPQTGDCGGTDHAFLRFVDLDSSARGVPSNK